VFIVVSVYFVIDSVRKLFDTPSYLNDLPYNLTCYLGVAQKVVMLYQGLVGLWGVRKQRAR